MKSVCLGLGCYGRVLTAAKRDSADSVFAGGGVGGGVRARRGCDDERVVKRKR